MARVVNHRDLTLKYFDDSYLDEWEITMNGSRGLQTWSCWTLSSAEIPFSPNTELSNSIGIALNSKASVLLVWSQTANRGGREGNAVSGTSSTSSSWPFLDDTGIIRWKWRSTWRHLKSPQGSRKEIDYPALHNPSLSMFVFLPQLWQVEWLFLCLENEQLLLSTQRFPGKSLITFNYYFSADSWAIENNACLHEAWVAARELLAKSNSHLLVCKSFHCLITSARLEHDFVFT